MATQAYHPPPPIEDIPCATCGKIFTRDRASTWKRLCIGCWWREMQARRAAEARTAPPEQGAPAWTPELQAERDRLAAEVADLRTRLVCHPDKHPEARQAEATAATQDLLQLRKRIQGGA